MKKSVNLEKNLKIYLKNLKTDGIIPGLLLGQKSINCDFIVHLARTPICKESSNDGSYCVKQIQHLKEEWILDHIKNVTQMLPGGMTILGLFFVGESNLFSNGAAVTYLKTMLSSINKYIAENEFYFMESNSEKIVLSYVDDFNVICKQFSTSEMGSYFDSVNFIITTDHWHRINCYYNFQYLSPLYVETITNVIIHEKIMDILKCVGKSVRESVLLLNGDMKNQNDLIKNIKEKVNERIVQNVGDSEIPSQIIADLYAPCEKQFTDLPLEVSDYNAELKCFGTLYSDVYLHKEATVNEATKAIKEDIIRSLCARLMMHCNSLMEDLSTSSTEETKIIHEPPRRVSIYLPRSKVRFTDYLFPGEDSLCTLPAKEQLDIQSTEDQQNLYESLELETDASEFYINDDAVGVTVSIVESSKCNSHFAFSSGIIISIIVIIIAIFIKRLCF